jgi:selenocysteine lyase/cysteine desulfurase
MVRKRGFEPRWSCDRQPLSAYPGPQFPYRGIRITPNVYTTLEEVDTFAEAIEDVLKNGLPRATA